MKIALAQIDARLGDIEGICARIESQAVLAHEKGARVLCTPSPLFCGLTPGALIEEPNFIHDLLLALTNLADRLKSLDIAALIPSIVGFDGMPLFEVFILREGRVVPIRSLAAMRRGFTADDPWVPPVFDIDGVRMGVTFDLLRDIDEIPAGTDLMIFFQSTAFELENEFSASVAAVPDGYFSPIAAKSGVWIACMAPVGGFEDLTFTGGSFVMDDDGSVVSAAPCFEEALLVADVQRGTVHPTLDTHDLPQYRREAWLWDALRCYLHDFVIANNGTNVALELTGDLPSTLTAALCVDALGPRHVIGVLMSHEGSITPEEEDAEAGRVSCVRTIARALGLQLVERSLLPVETILDRDDPRAGSPYTTAAARSLCLSDVAYAYHAILVSSATKTHRALSAQADFLSGDLAMIAPFGDVCLTELEFIARERIHAGSSIPAELVSLEAIKRVMQNIIVSTCTSIDVEAELADQACAVLSQLEPLDIDGLIEDHVNRGLELESTNLGSTHPVAASILLMLIRKNEAARRRLATAPLVSMRAFSERAWPTTVAWTDTGRHGSELATLAHYVQLASDHFVAQGEERGEHLRDEIMNIIANMLGISAEQLNETNLEQELLRRMQEGMDTDEGMGATGLFGSGMMGSNGSIGSDSTGPGDTGPHEFRFFSPN